MILSPASLQKVVKMNEKKTQILPHTMYCTTVYKLQNNAKNNGN